MVEYFGGNQLGFSTTDDEVSVFGKESIPTRVAAYFFNHFLC